MNATRVNQITSISPVNLVSRCFTLFIDVNCARGGGMNLQFDACVTMTIELVRSVIYRFDFWVICEPCSKCVNQ
jgi:hypothetical protein